MPSRTVLCAAAAALVACGSSQSSSTLGPEPHDWPTPQIPTSEIAEAGVRRETLTIAGAAAPANPTTSGFTVASLNATVVFRYRTDATPAAAVRAIVIAMPGFLAGAGSFDLLARALVRRGAKAGQPIEVWALDRRANLLEDRRGFAAAVIAGNPEIAQRYYFGADTIAGAKFAGFLAQDKVDYLSEWGLAVHAEDLRRVLARVPQDSRKARVFLAGHSLGSFFTEAYAAWRFADGTRGFDELAGLILLDGSLGNTPLDEAGYNDGKPGLIPTPGLTAIRKTSRYAELPLLGVSVLPRAEVLAQRAAVAPSAVIADADRDSTLGLLLGLAHPPKMTNKAAIGFAFDRHYSGLVLNNVTIGAVKGGAVAAYTNPIFQASLLQPTDLTATYDWDDAASAAPPKTNFNDFCRAFSSLTGDFVEWYFPARLSLDLNAVGGASVPETGWQAAAGLRSFDGKLNDAPVLAVAGGLATVADMTAIGARVAANVGAGRPNAGAPRTSPAGFKVIDATSLTHVDVLTAFESADNPVHGAIEEFVRANAAAGTVAPP